MQTRHFLRMSRGAGAILVLAGAAGLATVPLAAGQRSLADSSRDAMAEQSVTRQTPDVRVGLPGGALHSVLPESGPADRSMQSGSALEGRRVGTVSSEDILVIFVHGIDPSGYMDEGRFGVEEMPGYVGANLRAAARAMGLAMGNEDPYASSALSSTDYYGTQPPPYWTAQDQSDLDAVDAEYGGGIPSYALIVAKFARFRLAQSGAKQLALMAHSMGGEVTRWIIEHDLEGLVSSGTLNRWIPVSGVIQGDIMTEWIPELLLNSVGTSSDHVPPEFHQLDKDWLNDQYGGDAGLADNPLYAQILMTHLRTTDPMVGDQDMSFAFFGQPNDTVVSTKDMTFHTVEDQARWMDLDGNLLEPSVMEVSRYHDQSIDDWSTVASVMANLFGRIRVTLTLEDLTVTDVPDGSKPGELFYDLEVQSPYWQDFAASAGVLQETRWEDRLVPPIKARSGETEYLSLRLFDMPVMDEERFLDVTLSLTEVDCFRHWGILENCGDADSDSPLGEVFVRLPIEPGNWVLRNDKWSALVHLKLSWLW